MWRVTTVFSGVQGAPYYSNHYFPGTTTPAEGVEAVDEFWDGCASVMVDDCSWTVQGEVVDIDVTSGQPVGFTTVTGANGAGTLTGEMQSPAIQMLVRWTSEQVINGRLLRGRTFIPAIAETMNDGGRPSATAVADVQAAASALIVDIDSDIGVWSRTHGAFAVVTNASVWEEYAVLRSRRD